MAEAYKNLGQAAPAAATLTPLYTVPAAKQAVVSTIIICNTSGPYGTGTGDNFRLSFAVNGAADTIAQYMWRDVFIPAGDTFTATIGITMTAGDVIRCYSTSGICSFNLSGSEIS